MTIQSKQSSLLLGSSSLGVGHIHDRWPYISLDRNTVRTDNGFTFKELGDHTIEATDNVGTQYYVVIDSFPYFSTRFVNLNHHIVPKEGYVVDNNCVHTIYLRQYGYAVKRVPRTLLYRRDHLISDDVRFYNDHVTYNGDTYYYCGADICNDYKQPKLPITRCHGVHVFLESTDGISLTRSDNIVLSVLLSFFYGQTKCCWQDGHLVRNDKRVLMGNYDQVCKAVKKIIGTSLSMKSS